jgi:hypothetical protein
MSRPTRFLRAGLLASLLIASLSACSSIEFKRDTESSGTFVATGTSFTLFGVDFPRSALNQARENASDAGLHHMLVTEADVWPYFGPVDFLLEILSIRYAVIEGTWGYSED